MNSNSTIFKFAWFVFFLSLVSFSCLVYLKMHPAEKFILSVQEVQKIFLLTNGVAVLFLSISVIKMKLLILTVALYSIYIFSLSVFVNLNENSIKLIIINIIFTTFYRYLNTLSLKKYNRILNVGALRSSTQNTSELDYFTIICVIIFGILTLYIFSF